MAIQLDLTNSSIWHTFCWRLLPHRHCCYLRMREGGPKFTVMIDVSGYATATPDDDTREVDFRRYHADLADVEHLLVLHSSTSAILG